MKFINFIITITKLYCKEKFFLDAVRESLLCTMHAFSFSLYRQLGAICVMHNVPTNDSQSIVSKDHFDKGPRTH